MKNVNENEVITLDFDDLFKSGFTIDIVEQHKNDEDKIISEKRTVEDNIRRR